jgi:predicted aconitase
MNIAVATYPRSYVRPMEKHELELVTSTCIVAGHYSSHKKARKVARDTTAAFFYIWY